MVIMAHCIRFGGNFRAQNEQKNMSTQGLEVEKSCNFSSLAKIVQLWTVGHDKCQNLIQTEIFSHKKPTNLEGNHIEKKM